MVSDSLNIEQQCGVVMDGLKERTKVNNARNETIRDLKREKPKKYVLIFHDDSTTTKPFVVGVLKEDLHKSDVEAKSLMETVHTKGMAAVAVYPSKELAETKACIIMNKAKKLGFPFAVTHEQEEE